jgi:hypothetical protein
MFGTSTFSHKFIRETTERLANASGADLADSSSLTARYCWAVEEALKTINQADDAIQAGVQRMSRRLAGISDKLAKVGSIADYDRMGGDAAEMDAAIAKRASGWAQLVALLPTAEMDRVRMAATGLPQLATS